MICCQQSIGHLQLLFLNSFLNVILEYIWEAVNVIVQTLAQYINQQTNYGVNNILNSCIVAGLFQESDEQVKGRKPGSDQKLAIITSQLRRRISCAKIRANYTLLL